MHHRMSQAKTIQQRWLLRPWRQFATKTFDVAIVGSGPAGYVAAIKAAQLGLSTACVERGATLGGTCLNVGCIPSKSLLHNSHLYHLAKDEFEQRGISFENVMLNLPAMQKHKENSVQALTKGIEMLFKKNNVSRFNGFGKLAGPNEICIKAESASTENISIHAKHVIIATGSVPIEMPGVKTDEENIVTSTGALSFKTVPKHLVVIGGGIIGLELGSVWKRLGANVTVIEGLGKIGGIAMDQSISQQFQKSLERQGMKFILNKKVSTVEKLPSSGYSVHIGERSIECDKILVAIGRKPFTEGLELQDIGVTVDARGRIIVNDRFETNIPSIRAIGDVIQGPMLAHKAEEEALACVESIATGNCHLNYDAIPSVVYTMPEVAWVGLSNEQLRERGIPFKVGIFPFIANSRAKTIGDVEGMVKVVMHEKTGVLLGAHILGPNASEMIAEAGVAVSYGASCEDIARVCHAHPTFSEAFKEACMAAYSKAIHM